MEIYVSDTKNKIIDVVNRYSSLIWAKRYNTFGDFEIVIPAQEADINLFRNGAFLTRSDDSMIGLIERLELKTSETGKEAIVSGRCSKALLNRRVDIGQRNVVSVRLEDYIKKLISENFYNNGNRSLSRIENYVMINTGISVTEQTENIVIGDYICELCRKYGYGFDFFAFEDHFSFTLKRGIDRRNTVVFSKNRENLLTSSFVEDKTNFANVIITQDDSSGLRHVTIANNEVSGFNRYEAVNNSGTSSTVDLTEDQVLELWPEGQWVGADGIYYCYGKSGLIATHYTNGGKNDMTLMGSYYNEFMNSKAEKALNEKKIVTTMTPVVLPNVTHMYKTDYDVGDIVGIEDMFSTYAVRVSGAIESWDENGQSLDLELEAIN